MSDPYELFHRYCYAGLKQSKKKKKMNNCIICGHAFDAHSSVVGCMAVELIKLPNGVISICSCTEFYRDYKKALHGNPGRFEVNK